MNFRTDYTDKLLDKENFYNKVGQNEGDMENSQAGDDRPQTFTLTGKQMADIKAGIEKVRVSTREKVLGRLPGAKRGESAPAYAG